MIVQPILRHEAEPATSMPHPVLGGDAEASRQARLMEIYRPGPKMRPELSRRAPAWFDRA